MSYPICAPKKGNKSLWKLEGAAWLSPHWQSSPAPFILITRFKKRFVFHIYRDTQIRMNRLVFFPLISGSWKRVENKGEKECSEAKIEWENQIKPIGQTVYQFLCTNAWSFGHRRGRSLWGRRRRFPHRARHYLRPLPQPRLHRLGIIAFKFQIAESVRKRAITRHWFMFDSTA